MFSSQDNCCILVNSPPVRPHYEQTSTASEAGFILPLVIIVVAVGALVVIGVLGITSAILKSGANDTESLLELYAAESGIQHIMGELRAGADILSPGYTPPGLVVNGLNIHLTVAPPTTLAPASDGVYVDPLVNTVSAETSHRFIFENSIGPHIKVNWQFEPSVTSTLAFLQQTTTTLPTPPSPTTATTTPGHLEVTFSSPSTVTSNEFDSLGNPSASWIFVQAQKDYVVIAKAGATTVTAYLRQIPGPTDPKVEQDVRILTWKPFGTDP